MALPNPGMNFTPYDTLTAAELDNLVENIEALSDGSGLEDASITQNKLATGADFATGWNVNALPPVSSVVANGNRSYTLTHASSVASLISAGMRRRFTRTTAANTYMGGAFNGSSHYFTKTSPSGTLGTVTNNFTIEAVVQPTSYAVGYVCARADAATNNGLGMYMQADGRISAIVYNTANANYRFVSTYQSLPLNKKTHVAASWTGGTVVIYFDGVSVPVQAAAVGGTAPTTAGTGGDFSIGRCGAYTASGYFPGYISNFAVFDAVLSAATIKQHASYKLTGSETNCIGAWSLDNTPNDQSSAGNNLTATGGVGFSNVSPFGNNGVTNNLEYGLTMSVSSDGLTEVVQCPEGCALPTTGGITASAYSSMANPYGWVSDKGRWEIGYINTGDALQTAPVSGTYYNPHSAQLNVPIGSYKIEMLANGQCLPTASANGDLTSALSTSASAATSDFRLKQWSYHGVTTHMIHRVTVGSSIKPTTATPYYAICSTNTACTNIGFRLNLCITATPNGL